MIDLEKNFMSFLEFSQKAENPTELKGSSNIVNPDYYTLTAQIVFETYQPNWVSKGAIRSQFGRVALPSNFDNLPHEQKLKVATDLAKNHYAEYANQVSSDGSISNYYLMKNGKFFEYVAFDT